MRAYPNLHPRIARYLGIRLMYAPPFRHVAHAPTRPLVVRSSLSFPGASLYFREKRRNLRRRFIMDIVQMFSFFPLAFLLALLVSRLIDNPFWHLISIIPQTCLILALMYSTPFRSFYARFADWWMRRFPHA
ncbi:hypothetical protein [uncultured Bilophila sp.]|uniref:hypothetical protein n=1 Tax=uncultured Bilophila sp. TaxID=529385 RepID=UPI0025D013B5|nr:hypothetical protein [uncultured Bilophila sp.]